MRYSLFMKLITQTQDLEIAIAALRQSDFVTVDTEFIRESTFWPILCLIQIASEDVTALIDPLAEGIDLKSFFDLMSDKSTLKVFHAARQDIEIIYHLGNIIPEPLFDTQIAGSVCGYGESVSYDQIVQRITGHHLDKSSRFTDWAYRPLSESQLTYALADVTYLRDVYIDLKNQLDKTKRNQWVNEEMAILLSPLTYDMPEEEAWKRVKGRIRKPRELAILQKVAAWREREARARNVPRGRIMKDDSLIEIAVQQPKDETALSRLRSVAKGWERSQGAQDLLKAVHDGLETDVTTLPPIQKQIAASDGKSAAMDLLKVLLKLIADDNQIAPKVIANNDDIDKIARGEKNETIQCMQGWRYDMFGKKAQAMMQGQLYFYFDKGKIKVKEIDDSSQ